MAALSFLSDVAVLTTINKVVGVFLALAGAFLAVPSAWGLLGRAMIGPAVPGWARRALADVRAALARVLPFLRKDQTVHPATVDAGTLVERAMLQKYVGLWEPNLSIEERIEVLRKYVIVLDEHINEMVEDVYDERMAREEAIAAVRRELAAETGELRQLIDEKDGQTARMDARGLPLIAVGIALTGIPEFIAEVPPLTWLLVLVGVWALLVAVPEAVRAHRRDRKPAVRPAVR